ncbi:uncharacterized protein FOMMEDRAFT_154468 [Fomitiporia mediterranea MF3/22]|uniref:uncharacterized protein n=1 Tax=Fomitiporia mediterranea (strain MF3/22) TaxID=694068 RepID=UPI000440823E|nr:uncharacterized protein FOMMEDRAFT_154468 [Fomitiporia mediterranea MF3/22]EJD05248.1 hypothetical protein FOMMEDRAFT_154468 [Fomitiporia mediterranea MF3/22]
MRWTGDRDSIPPPPLKCDTIDALPRFGGPEYGFEDEGELATPFVGEFRVAFPLIRDATDVLPRNGKPEHGFESEGELATPLVSKSVPRLSDRLSGVFRRRGHQFPVAYARCHRCLPRNEKPEHGFESEGELATPLVNKSVPRLPTASVESLVVAIPSAGSRSSLYQGPDDSDSASHEVGTDNMRRVPVPLLVTNSVFPPKHDTINVLLRFGKLEHGFEDEGELATPFVIKSVSRFSIRLSGVFRRRDHQCGVKISSCFPAYGRYHRRIPWVSKPEYGFEDEGDLAIPFVNESVPRLSDRLIGAFRRAARSQCHPQSSCFSICRVSLNVPCRFRVAFPLIRDAIGVLPRNGKPEHGFESEGELATPLVSKSVPRLSDRLSGVSRRRNHQRGVKSSSYFPACTRYHRSIPSQARAEVFRPRRRSISTSRLPASSQGRISIKVNDADDVNGDDRPMWFTDRGFRAHLASRNIGYRVFTIDRLSRMRAPEYKMNSKPEFCLSRLNTTPSMSSLRFRKPEHGFEDEGELATPFVSRSVSRFSDRIAKDFRCRSHQHQVKVVLSARQRFGLDDPDSASLVVGTDIEPSTRISTYSNPLIFLYRFSPFPLIRDIFNALPRSGRSEYGFEDEGELATPLISKLVPRFSDRIAGAFCRPDHQRLVKVIVSTKVSDADDVSNDDKLTWLTSPNNWCPGLLPFEDAYPGDVNTAKLSSVSVSKSERLEDPDPASALVESDAGFRVQSRQKPGNPPVLPICDTFDTLLRFAQLEYGFEYEGELATLLVNFGPHRRSLSLVILPTKVNDATDVNCDDRLMWFTSSDN